MPGYMTHYIFGELEYHNIENANFNIMKSRIAGKKYRQRAFLKFRQV